MPEREYRGDDRGISLAWQTPPWDRGETVDAPGDADREAGEERTSELDTADALDALDRGDGGDRDDRDAAADLEAASELFAEVVATTSPAEAHARLLRPTGDDLTSPDYTIQIDG
jgi:hypothetical protein